MLYRIPFGTKLNPQIGHCVLKFFLFITLCNLGFHIHALEDIVITAPRELQKYPAGSHTTVISVQNTNSSTKVADILNQSSGVYLSQSYGLKENTLSVRGFSQSQVKILIDGIPLESASAHSSLDEIPIALIDKIIVSRGPMSSLYGNSAMGGVINILTKKNYEYTKITSSYGSFSTWSLSAQTNLSRDKKRFYLISYLNRTNGQYVIRNRDSSLYDPGTKEETYTVRNNAQENFGGKIGFQNHKFHTSLTLNSKSRGIPGIQEQPTLHIHERRRDYNFSMDWTDLHSSPNTRSDFRLYDYGIFTDYHDPNGEQTGFSKDYLSKDQTRGAEFRIQWIPWELIVPNLRIEANREDFRDSSLRKSRNTFVFSSSADIFIGEDIFVITPSLSQTHASELPNEKSYGLSVLYNLIPQLSLKTQFGNSFRYPNFEELYLDRGYVVGNSDLQPEHSVGGEFGLLWKLLKFNGELSYFFSNTRDLIEYQQTGIQYKPFNFRKTQTKGVELEIEVGKILSTQWNTNLTWQEVRDSDPSSPYYKNFIPLKPWLYGRSSLDHDLARNFKFHTVYSFAKSRFVNIANTKKLADSHSLDLGLSSKFGEGYLARFDLRNLYDHNNVDVRGLPLPGRSYYITVEKSFF